MRCSSARTFEMPLTHKVMAFENIMRDYDYERKEWCLSEEKAALDKKNLRDICNFDKNCDAGRCTM